MPHPWLCKEQVLRENRELQEFSKAWEEARGMLQTEETEWVKTYVGRSTKHPILRIREQIRSEQPIKAPEVGQTVKGTGQSHSWMAFPTMSRAVTLSWRSRETDKKYKEKKWGRLVILTDRGTGSTEGQFQRPDGLREPLRKLSGRPEHRDKT